MAHLELGRRRHGVPELWGIGRVRHGTAHGGPGELDAVRMHAVPDERSHRNTAVLDLRVAQPADGGLVAHAPEVSLCETERVVESNNGIEVLGESLEVLRRRKRARGMIPGVRTTGAKRRKLTAWVSDTVTEVRAGAALGAVKAVAVARERARTIERNMVWATKDDVM